MKKEGERQIFPKVSGMPSGEKEDRQEDQERRIDGVKKKLENRNLQLEVNRRRLYKDLDG